VARVSQDALDKLTAFIETLPTEARNKCALCNETLVHLVKTAEVETGAGTATVTRALADKINEDAAPGDRVSSGALRQRVLNKEGAICRNPTNKTEVVCTEAFQFATIAISQLERIRHDDPQRLTALKTVEAWITENKPAPETENDTSVEQEIVWDHITKKMEYLINYLQTHARFPPNISQAKKDNVEDALITFNSFFDFLKE